MRAPRLWRNLLGRGAPVAEPQAAVSDPMALAETGITLRNNGRFDEAEVLFLQLIQEHPGSVLGWYELAVQRRLEGRAAESVELGRKALQVEPEAYRVRYTLALQLAKIGEFEEAATVLGAARASTREEQVALVSTRQFIEYVRRFPEARARALMEALFHGGAYLVHDAVEAAILRALRETRPFSLIRMGDGEGAWMQFDLEDEAAFNQLYELNRKDFLRIWFGDESLYESETFYGTLRQMDRAIETADVVGIPYPLRIDHEYRIFSSRGVPSCVNILRRAERQLASTPDAFVSSHDIHLDLQLTGGYRRILAEAGDLGVITCHRALAPLLQEKLDRPVRHVHLIPEEKGFTDIIGDNGVRERHFPSVFNHVIADLASHDLRGVLFLVAAGYLGKLYCDAIKSAGGIALDVGSVADGWVGKITRPTLAEIDRFAL